MRPVIAALVVALAACGGSPTAVETPVTPTLSPPLETTAVPTETSTPPALPRTRVDFSCRLPVYIRDGTQLNDAFVDFPDLRTAPAGRGGYYYDSAVSRWLPVTRNAVSPDRLRYAYTEGWTASPPMAPRVHIVDAASGTDIRVVAMPDAQPYGVADYTTAGVFLVIRYEGTAPGVWRIDPNTGALARVSNGYYQPAGPGFIGVVDRRDPNPYKSDVSGQEEWNRIDRRDAAGRMVTWMYQPGHALDWMPFNGQTALLVMSRSHDPTQRTEGVDWWLVSGPGRAARLAGYSGQDQSPFRELEDGFASAIPDSHGIWTGSASGLYLVTPSGSLLRVLDPPAYPAGICA